MDFMQALVKSVERKQKLEEIQSKVLTEVQLSDYYHMLFLKPIQCMLEENKGGLPKGLKVVSRLNELQYEAKPIVPILSYEEFSKLSVQQKKKHFKNQDQEIEGKGNQYSYIRYCIQNNADNLLCQMKLGKPMEIAICICMYNEDKEMLNNTLMGVGQNIAKLCQDGVDPDKIVVIIVQDGIQKMDKSILDLFQVLQAESGIRFGSQRQKKLQSALSQIKEIERNRQNFSWDGQENIMNLNCFLFSKEQEEARRNMRFTNVKREYDEIKSLLVEVNRLQNDKKVTHEDLPVKVFEIFRQECKKSFGGNTKEIEYQQKFKIYFEQILADIHRSRPLIQNALTKTSQYCKQYIQSRMQMSHVSFFRTNQFFPDQSGIGTQAISEIKTEKSKIIPKLHLKQGQQKQEMIRKLEGFQRIEAIKMNIFFVIKYKNAQKLSSHNWFFNGFCKQFCNFESNKAKLEVVSPKYTVLLDVGLRPQESALCKMYYTLENHHEQIGGVCGYMGLKLQKTGETEQKMKQDLDFFTRVTLHFVDIQQAQQMEYHFAHLIDKGFESIFKFIHVLPGAFSGYNMKAIWGTQSGNSDQLLADYFGSIGDKVTSKKFEELNLSFWRIIARVLFPNFILKYLFGQSKKDKRQTSTYEELMYESNVYLAEDRILCMGIHKLGYDLMFLPDAYSFVDPVKDLPSLMGQRKRWINGSYFAFEKVSDQFSQQGCCHIVNIQIWYLALMNMLSFVAPGFFLFSISVGMEAFRADVLTQLFKDAIPADSPIYDAFTYTINFIYAMLIFGLIYFSMNLTNRNKKFVRFVYGVSTVLGVMSMILLVILVVDLARGLTRGSSYLISNQNPSFIQNIPGGQATVDAIRYVVLGIMGLYGLPLLLYAICFRNIRVIFQVICGALSFAFYTPTYLIILNIYALCRMDDLSWGTKGLEAGQSKDATVLNSWKIIRTIHVGKLVFWNIVVAGLLIHFGSDYLVRFFLTFALMGIIGSTMLFKVLCGIIYYFYYKIFIKSEKLVNKKRQSRKEMRLRKSSVQPSNKQQSSTLSNPVRKYIESDYVPFDEPSLYTMLKSLVQENRSLRDQLKDEIKKNIKLLDDMSREEGNGPSVMVMQLMSFLNKDKAIRNNGTRKSIISGIISTSANKIKSSKNIFSQLFVKKSNKDIPPPAFQPINGNGKQSLQSQSDDFEQGKGLLHKFKNFCGVSQDQIPIDGFQEKKQPKPKKEQFHILKK